MSLNFVTVASFGDYQKWQWQYLGSDKGGGGPARWRICCGSWSRRWQSTRRRRSHIISWQNTQRAQQARSPDTGTSRTVQQWWRHEEGTVRSRGRRSHDWRLGWVAATLALRRLRRVLAARALRDESRSPRALRIIVGQKERFPLSFTLFYVTIARKMNKTHIFIWICYVLIQ